MKTEKEIRAKIEKLEHIDSEYPLINTAYRFSAQVLHWVLGELTELSDTFYCTKCNIIHTDLKCPICHNTTEIGSIGNIQ